MSPQLTLLALAAAILLAGCERRIPVLDDKQMASFENELPGMTAECLDNLRYGNEDVFSEPVDRCFQMEPQRRFDGLWRNQLETMIFCPAPEPSCAPWESRTWVSFASGYPKGLSYPGVFRISFLGRRTLKPGSYGHMGASKHEIVVDRVLSLKEVPDSAAGNPFVF